jgi:hypothetical protein
MTLHHADAGGGVAPGHRDERDRAAPAILPRPLDAHARRSERREPGAQGGAGPDSWRGPPLRRWTVPTLTGWPVPRCSPQRGTRIAFDREVADRYDANRLPVLHHRKSPDGILSHELNGAVDAVLGADGDQIATADVGDLTLARRAALGHPPDDDVAIGQDPTYLTVFEDDDITHRAIPHLPGRLLEGLVRGGGDGICRHHAADELFGLLLGSCFAMGILLSGCSRSRS